jgi:hypothetical protein
MQPLLVDQRHQLPAAILRDLDAETVKVGGVCSCRWVCTCCLLLRLGRVGLFVVFVGTTLSADSGSRIAGVRILVAMLAVAFVVAASGCAATETAESYCRNLYRPGGVGTPMWAEGQFNDEPSCEDWYVAARDSAGP